MQVSPWQTRKAPLRRLRTDRALPVRPRPYQGQSPKYTQNALRHTLTQCPMNDASQLSFTRMCRRRGVKLPSVPSVPSVPLFARRFRRPDGDHAVRGGLRGLHEVSVALRDVSRRTSTGPSAAREPARTASAASPPLSHAPPPLPRSATPHGLALDAARGTCPRPRSRPRRRLPRGGRGSRPPRAGRKEARRAGWQAGSVVAVGGGLFSRAPRTPCAP
jgi:hypothetical protein